MITQKTIKASDGLIARVVGQWTLDKLEYVEKYSKAFMTAMHPKRKQGKWDSLVYLDFLSGPGKCIHKVNKQEFDGSPLRALKILPSFDYLFFNDKGKKNSEALKRRIRESEKARVQVESKDCNVFVKEVVQKVSQKTLGLAFVDPEGFEVEFETLRLLGERRFDILFLFPGSIGIDRNLARFINENPELMDRFWGGSDWKKIPRARAVAGETLSPEELENLDLTWVNAYRSKMRKIGFEHQDEGDPCFVNESNSPMYHLLFFSKSPTALKIWRGVKKIEPSGQRKLL